MNRDLPKFLGFRSKAAGSSRWPKPAELQHGRIYGPLRGYRHSCGTIHGDGNHRLAGGSSPVQPDSTISPAATAAYPGEGGIIEEIDWSKLEHAVPEDLELPTAIDVDGSKQVLAADCREALGE